MTEIIKMNHYKPTLTEEIKQAIDKTLLFCSDELLKDISKASNDIANKNKKERLSGKFGKSAKAHPTMTEQVAIYTADKANTLYYAREDERMRISYLPSQKNYD